MSIGLGPVKNFIEKEKKELYSDEYVKMRKQNPDVRHDGVKSLANVLLNGIKLKRINELTPPEYKGNMWLGFIALAITLLVCLIGAIGFLTSL